MKTPSRLLAAPKPYIDESMAGYILRLTEENVYEKINCIYLLSDLWETVKGRGRNGNLINPNTDNIKKLSRLTNCTISELEKILYISKSSDLGEYKFFIFNHEIPREAIHTNKTKICPLCLKENSYHKKIWDIVSVSTCIYHKCLLIDECPGCQKQLTWSRNKIKECKCGKNLIDITSTEVREEEVILSKIFFKGFDKSNIDNINNNPLHKLPLKDLYIVLVFFSWFLPEIKKKWKLRNKYMGVSLNNREIHNLYSKVYRLFNNWPTRFFDFLKEIEASNRELTTVNYGISKTLGSIYKALYNHLSSKHLEFILAVTEEYIAKEWKGGYIGSLRKFSLQDKTEFKYMSGTEVSKFLNKDSYQVKELIYKGELNGTIKDRGSKGSLILIEKDSVIKYKEKLSNFTSNHINLSDAGSLLGLSSRKKVIELINHGLIKALRGPTIDGCNRWLIERKSIHELLRNIESKKAVSIKGNLDKKLITFKQVLRITGYYKYSVVDIVKGILKREIIPFNNTGIGFQKYMFSRKNIRDFFLIDLANKSKEYITAREMTTLIGVKRENIADWMKKGFLEFKVDKNGGYKSPKHKFYNFIEAYTPLSYLAKRLNTNSKNLYDKLVFQKIFPVTGPRVDGGKQYLYLNNDLGEYKKLALKNEIFKI